MARTVPPLNRLALRAAAAAVVAVGATGAVVLLPDDPSRPTSSAYRIGYDVEDLVTGMRTTELVEVDRPRVSRRLLDDGGSATTESGVYDRSPTGEWRQLAVVAPGEPGADLQLTAPLAWAEGARLARRDGTGSVTGRACTWWLTREPLDVSTFMPATDADRARSCVDEQGLLLADDWRAGDRELRRRTATSVTLVTSVSAFDGSTPKQIDQRLVTTVVEQIPGPTTDLVRPVPPPGFEVHSAVRTVEVAPGTTDVIRRVQRAVYLRDGVVVVLDQARSAGMAEPRGERAVDLGRLGTGRVSAAGGGIIVEVRVGDGLVRIRSGLGFERLVTWLETLEPQT